MIDVYILHTSILFESCETTTFLKFLASKIILNFLLQCTCINFFLHLNQTIFISVTGQRKQSTIGYLKQMSKPGKLSSKKITCIYKYLYHGSILESSNGLVQADSIKKDRYHPFCVIAWQSMLTTQLNYRKNPNNKCHI